MFDRLMEAGASPMLLLGNKKTTLHAAAAVGSDYMLEKLLMIPQMRRCVNDVYRRFKRTYWTQPRTPLQVIIGLEFVDVVGLVIIEIMRKRRGRTKWGTRTWRATMVKIRRKGGGTGGNNNGSGSH